ncbi:MAG: hypothetical protein K1X89_27585 [Myxococcaceae bacterium]|nr:hypothetical protein [Myxococcaceae bacterium]
MLAGCGVGEATDASAADELIANTESATGQSLSSSETDGARLFALETFDGNGRTCATCHTANFGAITPQQIQAAPSSSPIFRRIDADDPSSPYPTYNRLKRDATVLVTINLPSNIVIIGQPNKRSITVPRAVPSIVDMAALDTTIMLDGREPTLQHQALGAAHAHAQVRREPTAKQLDQIAAFEKKLFSSAATYRLAKDGTDPGLPQGRTDSEKRGRAFFDGPQSACGQCHQGGLLNMGGFPLNIGVSAFNKSGAKTYNWGIKDPATGAVTPLADAFTGDSHSPDPGAILTTGNPDDFNAFKMVSLRNIKNTAPYFHDNSAKTLAEVMDHYAQLFSLLGFEITAQDKADAIAYMKLL